MKIPIKSVSYIIFACEKEKRRETKSNAGGVKMQELVVRRKEKGSRRKRRKSKKKKKPRLRSKTNEIFTFERNTVFPVV